MSLLNKYSAFNHFKVFSGKNNSFCGKSKKYNLSKKELCILFIKNITKDDINNIAIYLKLDSDDYLFVMKECFSLINKQARLISGTDYKDLFMERVLLNSCYSAITLLKILNERKEKEEITEKEFLIIKELNSAKHLLEKNDRILIKYLWYSIRFRKISKLHKERMYIIQDKYIKSLLTTKK